LIEETDLIEVIGGGPHHSAVWARNLEDIMSTWMIFRWRCMDPPGRRTRPPARLSRATIRRPDAVATSSLHPEGLAQLYFRAAHSFISFKFKRWRLGDPASE